MNRCLISHVVTRTHMPLTEEDSRIWTRAAARYAYDGSFFLSQYLDRRDANRMLALRQARRQCDIRGFLNCVLVGWETALQGYDYDAKSLMGHSLETRIPRFPSRYR